MEFPLLSHRRSSSRSVPSGGERGETDFLQATSLSSDYKFFLLFFYVLEDFCCKKVSLRIFYYWTRHAHVFTNPHQIAGFYAYTRTPTNILSMDKTPLLLTNKIIIKSQEYSAMLKLSHLCYRNILLYSPVLSVVAEPVKNTVVSEELNARCDISR